MGTKRQKLKIFLGDGGGGRLFRWRVYFAWLGLEFGVKIPRPIIITLTLCYPLPWKIRALGVSVLFPTLTNNLKKFTVFVTWFTWDRVNPIDFLDCRINKPLAWLLIREWILYKLSPENEETVSITLVQKEWKLLTCRMKGLYGNFSATLVIVFSNKIAWKKKNLGNVRGRIILESRDLYLLFAKKITNYQQFVNVNKIWKVTRNSNGIESKHIRKIILAKALSRI